MTINWDIVFKRYEIPSDRPVIPIQEANKSPVSNDNKKDEVLPILDENKVVMPKIRLDQKEWMKVYLRLYMRLPKMKKYMKKYQNDPKNKARAKKLRNLPETKAREKISAKKWRESARGRKWRKKYYKELKMNKNE